MTKAVELQELRKTIDSAMYRYLELNGFELGGHGQPYQILWQGSSYLRVTLTLPGVANPLH